MKNGPQKYYLLLLIIWGILVIILYHFRPKMPISTLPAFKKLQRTILMRLDNVEQSARHDKGLYVINSDPCGRSTQDLLIVVPSATQNRVRRLVFRATTGNFVKKSEGKIKLMFFLGRSEVDGVDKAIQRENDTHGDIVQINYTDTYERLVFKSISMLRWIKDYCPNTTFVLKVDDDRLVNVPALVTSLKELLKHRDTFFQCLVWKKAAISRDVRDAHYVPYSVYNSNTFPDYCGSTYAYPGRLVSAIYETSMTLASVPVEDAFVTGIVAEKLGIPRIHNNHYLYPGDKRVECHLKNLFVSGELSAEEIQQRWTDKALNKNCDKR